MKQERVSLLLLLVVVVVVVVVMCVCSNLGKENKLKLNTLNTQK